jgi:hypothetical protein
LEGFPVSCLVAFIDSLERDKRVRERETDRDREQKREKVTDL